MWGNILNHELFYVLRLAELKKYRDGFLEIAQKAGQHVDWEEHTHPLDVEYVKRYGGFLWEEEDDKLSETRIRELEDELGIKRGDMDFVEFSDVFVVGLAVAFCAQ